MQKKQEMLERSVMASVIMGDAAPSQLGLTQAHFSDALCARLFALAMRLEADRKAISLVDICMADDTLDAQAVVDITKECCVSEVVLRQHCALMREQAVSRSLQALLRDTLSALESGAGGMATAQALTGKLSALVSTGSEAAGASMMELIFRLLSQIEQRSPQDAPPIASGVERIDECLNGGFRPGDLAVIAALTSVGKSALLSFMMRNAARQGKHVLLISCEMSEEQNAERFLASISRAPLDKIIRREALTEAENISISDGMSIYHPECIRVISSGTQTVESVRREALRMQMTEGLDMIVVDYLQRMRSQGRSASKADEVGSIASGLKSLAVDLKVPVLTAAQFNREAAKARREARGNENEGVPALHQLRDSSQIEDEANTVIVMDEPERALGSHVRQINAHIVKNRSGALKSVRLLFDPTRMIYAQADA